MSGLSLALTRILSLSRSRSLSPHPPQHTTRHSFALALVLTYRGVVEHRHPAFFYSSDAMEDRQNRIKDSAAALPLKTMAGSAGNSAAAAAIVGGAAAATTGASAGGGGGADFAAVAVGMMRENAALRDALAAAHEAVTSATTKATKAAQLAATAELETFDVRVRNTRSCVYICLFLSPCLCAPPFHLTQKEY